MDNACFQTKIAKWLKDSDTLPNAIWSLTESKEVGTIVVKVYIKELLYEENNLLLTRELTGTSLTKDSEIEIHTAVLALNDELLEKI